MSSESKNNEDRIEVRHGLGRAGPRSAAPLAGNEQITRPLLDAQSPRVQLLMELIEGFPGKLSARVTQPAVKPVVLQVAPRVDGGRVEVDLLEGLFQEAEGLLAAGDRRGATRQLGLGPGDVQAAAQEAILTLALLEQPDVIDFVADPELLDGDDLGRVVHLVADAGPDGVVTARRHGAGRSSRRERVDVRARRAPGTGPRPPTDRGIDAPAPTWTGTRPGSPA